MLPGGDKKVATGGMGKSVMWPTLRQGLAQHPPFASGDGVAAFVFAPCVPIALIRLADNECVAGEIPAVGGWRY